MANGMRALEQPDFDPVPGVKLFTPDAGGTWLLAWIDPEDHTIAHGLCDPGLGCPEVGPVSLEELAAMRGVMRLRIEQDLHFRADKRLGGYARIATRAGRIEA